MGSDGHEAVKARPLPGIALWKLLPRVLLPAIIVVRALEAEVLRCNRYVLRSTCGRCTACWALGHLLTGLLCHNCRPCLAWCTAASSLLCLGCIPGRSPAHPTK